MVDTENLLLQYNGCKWLGGVLKVEKAKEHYSAKLQREKEAESSNEEQQPQIENSAVEESPSAESLRIPTPASGFVKRKVRFNMICFWLHWRIRFIMHSPACFSSLICHAQRQQASYNLENVKVAPCLILSACPDEHLHSICEISKSDDAQLHSFMQHSNAAICTILCST